MRVADDHVCEPGVQQVVRTPAGARPESAFQRRGGQLDQRTCVDEVGHQFRVFLHLGVAFRVGDDGCDTGAQESRDDVREGGRPAGVGGLEEQARRVATEAEAVEIVGTEPVELLERELAAGKNDEIYSSVVEGSAEVRETVHHRARRRRIVLAHVRGRGDDANSILHRSPGDLDCLVEVTGAVVEPGKDVGVEIDHVINNAFIRALVTPCLRYRSRRGIAYGSE